MKHIVLFFGSFNPVHKGHIALAETILEQQIAEEVWFVLSPQSPFKAEAGLAPEAEREKKLAQALEGKNGLSLCSVELSLPKPSYTIQTLQHLWNAYPDCRFSLLMGQDNIAGFHKWKDYRLIVEKCDIYVYPRQQADAPGNAFVPLPESATGKGGTKDQRPGNRETPAPSLSPAEMEYPERIHRISGPLFDISSTQIREMARQGKDVSRWLP